MPENDKRPVSAAAPVENSENGEKVKIYILPNLMTAGNLTCGFFALTWIFKYSGPPDYESIQWAIYLILVAFVCDFLDGRLARLAKKESQFGREFDSLADIVSFGAAPAFLVYRIVLQDFHRASWVIAAFYLVCGGIRLARFNVLSQIGGKKSSKEFIGFPIPSAAAVVVSVTLFIIWLQERERTLGTWRFTLPVLMVLLSVLMVSTVRYPTFKQIDWTPQRSIAAFAGVVVIALLVAVSYQITLALLFVVYMLYGLVRPWVSKSWRREIEPDDADDDATEG